MGSVMTQHVDLKLTLTREELIDALKARLPWAREFDKRAKVAHREAERAFLAKWRDMCRAAGKWTYEEAKAHKFEVGGYDFRNSRPACPAPVMPLIRTVLGQLAISNQKTFTLAPATGGVRNTHWLLTHDEALAAELKATC